MRVPKRKKTQATELVVLDITFECPNHHPITVEYLHFRPQQPDRKRSGVIEIDDSDFSLHCLVCGWEGMRRGSDRRSLQLAERNRRTD